MTIRSRKVTVAAVQAAPVLPMNKKATTEKACALIESAGRQGAQLIVFPECFIPMFPNWSIDLQRPSEWSLLLADLTEEAVEIPSEETAALCKAARRAGAHVCVGMNERSSEYRATIYNTLLFIGPDGNIIGRHRKFTPSHRERVFHARGDGSNVRAVFDTSIGRIGGLICFEHLQPLFRYALTLQGEEIHCACWPGGWPHFPPPGRSNRELTQIASRAYALESQAFVVLSSMYIAPEAAEKSGIGNAHWGFSGGSAIIDPAGNYIVAPVFDQETMLHAEVDLADVLKRKAYIDPVGRDARWDVFRLDMNTAPLVPVAESHLSPGTPPAENTGFARVEDKLDRLTEKLGALVDGLSGRPEKIVINS